MKAKKTAEVISQNCIGENIYDLLLLAPEAAREAVCGQFVNVYCRDKSRLLPRPISLCGIDPEKGQLRLVYRAGGAGTKEFSKLAAGDRIEILGPLGNGFPLREAAGKRIFLIGGGIGIPPLLQTAETLRKTGAEKITAVLGYQDRCFLAEEFRQVCETVVATESGAAGTKGNVLDAIREAGLTADMMFACGPVPMLRALKGYAAEKQMRCWLSLEERMACGIGACLACTCRAAETDGHLHVKKKRVCKDGPVFEASEVEL